MRTASKKTREDKYVQPFLSSEAMCIIDNAVAKANRRLKGNEQLEIEVEKTSFGIGLFMLQNGLRMAGAENNSLGGKADTVFQSALDDLVSDMFEMMLTGLISKKQTS